MTIGQIRATSDARNTYAQTWIFGGLLTLLICMYRAALELLMFDKGFTKGMLDAKIKELVELIDAGQPPEWARDLDTEYLRVMKELGNAAIHPND